MGDRIDATLTVGKRAVRVVDAQALVQAAMPKPPRGDITVALVGSHSDLARIVATVIVNARNMGILQEAIQIADAVGVERTVTIFQDELDSEDRQR